MAHLLCLKLGLLAIATEFTLHTVVGLNFQMSDIRHCVVNLVDSDSGLHLPTTDLIQGIITSNQVEQLWTLATMLPEKPVPEMWLGQIHYFREQCSVNIFVEIRSCSRRELLLIFLSRFHNYQNTFVFIYGTEEACKAELRQHAQMKPIVASILVLTLNGETLEEATSFCSSCSQDYRVVPIQLPLQSLTEVRRFADETRVRLILPVIAALSSTSGQEYDGTYCYPRLGWLCEQRKSTNSELVGCSMNHIYIENLAAKLNLSVEFVNHERCYEYTLDPPKHFSGVAVLGIFNTWIYEMHFRQVALPHLMSQFNNGEKTLKFVYCQKTCERESFNMSFWTVPLGPWSWLFLGTAVLVLLICLRGQWLEIVAILMRQSCSILDDRKLLIVFILVTIVFTYGYEGVVSSFLTAPPPFKVFDTLKQLLENGYKLIGFQPELMANPNLARLFESENISLSHWESSLVPGTFNIPVSLVLPMLAAGNYTYSLRDSQTTKWEVMVEVKYGVKCHTVRALSYPQNWIDTYVGPSREAMIKAAQEMAEAGIQVMSLH